MRVYTKIVFDIETMAVLESDFFYTDGPVALCKGDVAAPAPVPKTAVELETEALNLEAQKEYLDRLRNPEKYYTENEKLISQYTTEQLKSAIEGAPAQAEYQKKMMDYTSQLVDEATQRLSEIETIKSLSSYTGALTTDEKTMLDTMSQNAKDKITSAVNDETKDIVAAKISDLAARGVLNSSIATDLLGRVAESSQKAIAQGTTDIETARLGQELSIQQSNKDRALNWANYGLNQQQIFSGLAGQNFAQLQQPLQTATQQTQYASGLAQQYGSMATGGQSNWLALQSQERGSQANAALNAAIQTGQNKAGIASGQYAAGGAIAGAVVTAAIIA